ncbi:hypothetical protein WA026_004860 [Henosepilachna vigintioctopunctata]|uniref:protein-tyrosine-phosphatase n=1 Tax=Henosepilachna vigintioctopunctata TaxID=420089 RepID=A0AAW1URV7_9CUCU
MIFCRSKILFLILFFGCCFCVTCSDYLSLLRTDRGDVCITNSSSPLFYTLSNGTIKEGTMLIPQSSYDCNLGEDVRCTREFIKSSNWTNVISSEYENIPIFDVRWEDLPVGTLSSTEPKEIMKLEDTKEFKITLSVRASKIRLFFCDGEDIKTASCYEFSVDGKNVCILEKSGVNARNPDTTEEKKSVPKSCEKIGDTHTNPPLIEMEKWRHLTLKKTNKYIYLRRIQNEMNEIIVRHEVQSDFLRIKYMLGTSENIAYYKLHRYKYLRTTSVSSSSHYPKIKATKITNNEACFSVFMTTCNSCWVDASASLIQNGRKILKTKMLPPSYGKWTEYKILFNIKDYEGEYVNIGFLTNGSNINHNSFWSIDNFRYCRSEEYRVSKQPFADLKKCELLNPSRNLMWRPPTDVESTECESSDLLGGLCIPCEELNKAHILTNCEKLRFCEIENDVQKCFCQSGFKGDECKEACEQGKFGRGCQQNLSPFFQDDTCHLPIKGNILKHPPAVISAYPTSCIIKFDNKEYGKYISVYYLLQYRKETSDGSTNEWTDFETTKYISQKREIQITNLEMSTKYFIRILVSYLFDDIKLLENTYIPFTICNTTCNEWNEKDINITEKDKTIFVNVEISKQKCNVTLYSWIIKSLEDDEILKGSAQNAMNFTDLPGGTDFLIYFLGPNSKNISKKFKTSDKAPEPPVALQSYFKDENNTFGIYWMEPNNTNGILKNFEIILKFANISRTYYEEPKNKPKKINEFYHVQFKEKIPDSEDVRVEVTASNSVRGETAIIMNSSYPLTPHLEDPQINIKNSTDTSISGEFAIAIKGHKNKKKNNFYIYILVSELSRNEDENLKILKSLFREVDAEKHSRIAAEFDLNDIHTSLLEFSIGRHNEQKSKLLNGSVIIDRPLKPDQLYNITILLVSRYKNKFCITSYKTKFATQKVLKKIGNDGQYALFLLLLLVPIILGLLIFRKKIYQVMATFSLRKIMCFEVINTTRSECNILEADEFTPEIRNSEIKMKTWTPPVNKYVDPPNPDEDILSKPIKIANLECYVRETIESGELMRQHALFSESHTQPCTYGSLVENKSKNRYNNLIAYDHSRVRLDKLPGNEFSDYINANFIHGYRIPNAFIATQGPKQSTLVDFWRMVWERNVKHIIMLANIYEGGKKKVEQYWPNVNEELTIGQVCIKFMAVEIFADFEYKTFNIKRGSEIRKLEQLHFTSWPDHGVPLYPQSLVPFLRKMLKIRMSSSHPVVIHCSAGVGRTGTILLSDICLRMAAKEGAVDLLYHLQKLRQQRPRMVDNVEQYKLAHLVILETLMGLHTSIPCNMMEQAMETLLSTEEYKMQMDYLIQTQWKDDAMKSVAEADENFVVCPVKNRFPEFVPDNKCRIPLTRYPESDFSSSYINAIKVDGFRNPGRFIVTQTPMPNTLGDFWRLVMEQQTRVIISLNELNLDDETCCQFFPTVKTPEIRPVDFLFLKLKKTQKMQDYDIHFVNMRLENKEERNLDIIILSFKLWKSGKEVPSNNENFLSFWEEADTISRRSKTVLVTLMAEQLLVYM